MRTQIRLLLDCGIQLLLILLLLLQITNTPTLALPYLGVFAFVISIWQIVHAIYVVEKYHDWYRGRYLKNIKTIIRWSLFFVLGGGIAIAVTFGQWLMPILQVMQYLGLTLGVIVSLVAFRYFGRSVLNLYHYYTKPKSFWDL